MPVISYHDIHKGASKIKDSDRLGHGSVATVNSLQIVFMCFARVAAIRFYYVEEMLASLLLFAVLFSCGAVVLCLLFMVNRASQALIAYGELWGRKVLHRTYLWRALNPGPRT
jgi:hypothetical protein